MSKSVGNVVNPLDVIKDYGTEPLRYYLLREVSSFEDSSFDMEHFKDAYNANLANGIGNLTSRIMKMAETNLDGPVIIPEENKVWHEEYIEAFHSYNLKKAIDVVFDSISKTDEKIQSSAPFKLVKTDPVAGKEIISYLVICLNGIAQHLEPFLPETSAKIKNLISQNKSPVEPLFLRKD